MVSFSLFSFVVALPALISSMQCRTELNATINNGAGYAAVRGTVMGYKQCGSAETRCGQVFNADMSIISRLQGAKDEAAVAAWIDGKEGVFGKALMCMTEADCTLISSSTQTSCNGVKTKCCCTTDGCTNGTGTESVVMALLTALLAIVAAL